MQVFHPSSRHGVAILIALGVLAMLAMLATVFASIARMERNVAAAGVDQTRARFLSRAGIEATVAGLRALSGKRICEVPREMTASSGGALHRSFQGRLPSTYEGGSDVYECEARDAASGIPLDRPHPFLASMLDTLGRAIAAMRPDGRDPVRGRGARIAALRDSRGGIRCRQDLLQVLSVADLESLAAHVMLGGWVDPTTVGPVLGRQLDPVAPLRREPRPPVDLNTASIPVLCAVIANVDSTLCEPIAFDAAMRVAREIDRIRRSEEPGEGPFDSLERLERFLNRLSTPPTSWLTREQAATLMVNLDPNLHLTRLNPDRVVARGVDKTRLTFYTFEAAFRSMGRYEITSVGRVRGPNGSIVAEVRTTVVAEVYGVLRETLQSEFEDGRESGPEDGTCTFPEANGSAPADWAGHIQLHPFHGVSAASTFDVPFEDSFLPREGAPPLLAPPAAGLLDRGRLVGDGASFRRHDEEPLAYAASTSLPSKEGTLEFWFKLNDSPTRLLESIWYSSQPLGHGEHLQHRISIGRDRKHLQVRSRRALAGPTEPASGYRETELFVEMDGAGVAGEWHHLSVSWWDTTRQRAFLDGRPFGAEVRLGARGEAPSRPMGPTEDAMWLGAMPVGVDSEAGWMRRSWRDVTIDDVRVFPSPDVRDAKGFPPPDRFPRAESPIVGRFVGGFEALPFPAILHTISWTAWNPIEYEGNRLLDGVVGFRFGLLAEGESGDLLHDPASCPVCLGSGHFGGSGSHGGSRCPICQGTHDPGPAADPPDDDDVIDETEEDGSLVEGDIEDLGLPHVLVSREEIRYRIDFVSPRFLTPTNVTPIVDDVTLTYLGPIRFVFWIEE